MSEVPLWCGRPQAKRALWSMRGFGSRDPNKPQNFFCPCLCGSRGVNFLSSKLIRCVRQAAGETRAQAD